MLNVYLRNHNKIFSKKYLFHNFTYNTLEIICFSKDNVFKLKEKINEEEEEDKKIKKYIQEPDTYLINFTLASVTGLSVEWFKKSKYRTRNGLLGGSSKKFCRHTYTYTT